MTYFLTGCRRNMEETRLMVARHEAEVKELRERCSSLQNKIQRRHREYEQLTQNMKQLLEAQGVYFVFYLQF